MCACKKGKKLGGTIKKNRYIKKMKRYEDEIEIVGREVKKENNKKLM